MKRFGPRARAPPLDLIQADELDSSIPLCRCWCVLPSGTSASRPASDCLRVCTPPQRRQTSTTQSLSMDEFTQAPRRAFP